MGNLRIKRTKLNTIKIKRIMKCIICGISVIDKMLHRTNPKGQSDAGWMCMPCIENTQPELAKNIKEDQTPFEKDIPAIFYPSSQTP